MDHYKLFIDGEFVEAASGDVFETIDPGTGIPFATVAKAGKVDAEAAIAAARRSFDSGVWSNLSPAARADKVYDFADQVNQQALRIAVTESQDAGHTIKLSKFWGMAGAGLLRNLGYYASRDFPWQEEIPYSGNTLFQGRDWIRREPIGVCVGIVPWNFPVLMAFWKIAPALAAGNTVVIKPSSATSLSLLELAKLMSQVLPPGVVNVVTGRGSVSGNFLLEHPGLNKLGFTGSTEVGYTIADAAAKKLIPATLELGGKSANIFFPDAPWDKAIEGVEIGILFNQGQVCCAGSRVFVHEDIYDKFLADCVSAFNKVKVGLPWEKDTQMGAIVNGEQLQKILAYIEIGRKEGAKVACGGKRLTEHGLDKGFFMQPTILAGVGNKMRVAQEEIFGPVATFIKFKTEAEVIAMANDSEYGLGGAVWTKDINRALRVAGAVETGRMWVNNYNNLPAHAPFGGYKKSGIGRETHKMILEHLTQKKNIFISLTETKVGLY